MLNINGTKEEKKEFLHALYYVDRGLSLLIQDLYENNLFTSEKKAIKFRKLFEELRKELSE